MRMRLTLIFSLSQTMTTSSSLTRIVCLGLLAAPLASLTAQTTPENAAPATSEETAPVQLPAFIVEAESEADSTVQGPFLPDVQGVKINAGKKTSVLDLDALPAISGSNYRQALAQAPGLVLSEETTPLISIGYRGLDAHRAQFIQVLADGIPIHADQFGYPEAYYSPPLETIDRIEFLRGGAALMYGPQPGGALNFITHRPRTDREFSVRTEHTFGEDNTWNAFTSFDGTTGRVGYYGYYDHRTTDGFRASNSDVELDAWSVKLALDATGPSRWFLTLESYQEEHGEPGGLTPAQYAANRDQTTKPNDRFELERDAVTLIWERDLEAGQFTARAWAVDYTRASARETAANSGVFSNEEQNFHTFGLEGRYRRDWGSEQQHVLSAGTQLFYTDSPRSDDTGPSAFNNTAVARRSDRETLYAPVFVENLFRFGALSVTPGFRLENYRQTVNTRTFGPALTREREETDHVPLFGLGVAYDLPRQSQVYFNLSQGYRPPLFTEAVPNNPGQTIAGDLAEGKFWQTDLGYRSQPVAGLILDASIFYMEFSDKIGTVGTVVQNIGEVDYRGAELSAQYDLLRLAGGDGATQLNLYANALLLDAEVQGTGRSPAHAPDHVVRTGLIYTDAARRKIALTGTFADNTSGDDAGTREIPAYMVWDLTAEIPVTGTPVTLIAGINNLLNEDYFSRFRSDGIDPAPERNYYVGFRAEF